MAKSLLKLKNYEVHAISTAYNGQKNANIATWVMQSAMGGKYLTVALYHVDYTFELVRQSGLLNVNLLAETQTALIRTLGRQSGRDVDKFRRLPWALDARGCPYLTEAIGYIACEVENSLPSGDHELMVCRVVHQQWLHPEKPVLTHHYLRAKGLVRG